MRLILETVDARGGERLMAFDLLHGMQEVGGSIPPGSTNKN